MPENHGVRRRRTKAASRTRTPGRETSSHLAPTMLCGCRGCACTQSVLLPAVEPGRRIVRVLCRACKLGRHVRAQARLSDRTPSYRKHRRRPAAA